MATTVVMEALSPTMEEGRLVEWKQPEGAKVSVGDVLAEVETDKAIMELVARVDGTLLKHLVPAGSTVPVADPVGIIGEPGEDIGEGSGTAGQRGGARAWGGGMCGGPWISRVSREVSVGASIYRRPLRQTTGWGAGGGAVSRGSA